MSEVNVKGQNGETDEEDEAELLDERMGISTALRLPKMAGQSAPGKVSVQDGDWRKLPLSRTVNLRNIHYHSLDL